MLSVNRATKRFWITTITYVEITVVIKYVMQFQFPPDQSFNECTYYKDFANSPLCPPRIIGIERIDGDNSYVWDLMLLLSLLFHISSLKTQVKENFPISKFFTEAKKTIFDKLQSTYFLWGRIYPYV